MIIAYKKLGVSQTNYQPDDFKSLNYVGKAKIAINFTYQEWIIQIIKLVWWT